MLFQPGISVNMLGLDGAPWVTGDIHKLMSCLSIVKIATLFIGENCQLTYKSSSQPPKSPVRIDIAQIEASLTIDTMIDLLSHLEVNTLKIFSECLTPFYQDSRQTKVIYFIFVNKLR